MPPFHDNTSSGTKDLQALWISGIQCGSSFDDTLRPIFKPDHRRSHVFPLDIMKPRLHMTIHGFDRSHHILQKLNRMDSMVDHCRSALSLTIFTHHTETL